MFSWGGPQFKKDCEGEGRWSMRQLHNISVEAIAYMEK